MDRVRAWNKAVADLSKLQRERKAEEAIQAAAQVQATKAPAAATGFVSQNASKSVLSNTRVSAPSGNHRAAAPKVRAA